MTEQELPDKYMIIGSDGLPSGVIDLAELQSSATRFAYSLAAVAGDDDAVDAVAVEWCESIAEGSEGFISSAALMYMTRHVVGPLLDLVDTLGPELGIRQKLVESRDFAEQILSPGGESR